MKNKRGIGHGKPSVSCQLCGSITSWDNVLSTLMYFSLGDEPALFYECKSKECQDARQMPVFAEVKMKCVLIEPHRESNL